MWKERCANLVRYPRTKTMDRTILPGLHLDAVCRAARSIPEEGEVRREEKRAVCFCVAWPRSRSGRGIPRTQTLTFILGFRSLPSCATMGPSSMVRGAQHAVPKLLSGTLFLLCFLMTSQAAAASMGEVAPPRYATLKGRALREMSDGDSHGWMSIGGLATPLQRGGGHSGGGDGGYTPAPLLATPISASNTPLRDDEVRSAR